MAAELDFASKELGGAIDGVVNGIRTDPEIAGQRGEYARRAVVNAFSVWKQALAHLQSDAAAPTAAGATAIHLFEPDPAKIVYTASDREAANTAIQNASALIKRIVDDAELARWMANAMVRHTRPAPAATIGADLRRAIGDLTAYVAAPRRISTEYD